MDECGCTHARFIPHKSTFKNYQVALVANEEEDHTNSMITVSILKHRL